MKKYFVVMIIIVVILVIFCSFYTIHINKKISILHDEIYNINHNLKKQFEDLNDNNYELVERLNNEIEECKNNVGEVDSKTEDLNRRIMTNKFFIENSNYEKIFIKLKDIEVVEDKISLKYISSEFFTGEEAIKKYAEDYGMNEKEVQLGNGFYIKENGENTTSLSEDTLIILLNIMEQEYKFSTFEDLKLHFKNNSYWYNIYTFEDTIKFIEEVYIP